MNYSQSVVCTMLLVVINTGLFAGSNIRETKHNLSNKNVVVEDDELCVFCHTPNAPKTSFVNGLEWDKSVKLKSFVLYGASVAAGDDDSENNNNPSMACLGCHDGINAINVFANLSNMLEGMLKSNSILSNEMDALPEMRSNHPISVVYTPGKASLKETSSLLTGWANAKNISDLLRHNKVECGSCHDPHEATNSTFLRTANHGSSICIGCHGK